MVSIVKFKTKLIVLWSDLIITTRKPRMESQKPVFMSGVSPYMVRADNYIIVIRPISTEKGVLYFTDDRGRTFDVPDDIAIHVYERLNPGTITESILETDIKILPGTKHFELDLINSYSIYYKDYIITEGGKSVSGRLYEIGDLFKFPLSGEDLVEYNASRYTALIRGSIEKDSNQVKVSSTLGIEINKMITGHGIPDEGWITSIDVDEMVITMNQPATGSASNVTIEFSKRDLVEQPVEYYYDEYYEDDENEDEF
jgi:hypothetical protein